MPKRKVKELENGVPEQPRRSSRRKPSTPGDDNPSSTTQKAKWELGKPPAATKQAVSKKKKANAKSEPVAESKSELVKDAVMTEGSSAKITSEAAQSTGPEAASAGRQYWLMKAEPESRLENGHDIKFSIDDLAAKTKPEPWDGIRAYAARNNLRAMKKGDLAFFYHSSCKVPAIVGIMEIVAEHTPDLSAHDPSAPYHDASSTPENPKWSVVHVEFRQKLATPITLKELKAWQGGPLKEMQMLRLARMSVSKVSEAEWGFLLGEMRKRGDVVEL